MDFTIEIQLAAEQERFMRVEEIETNNNGLRSE